MANLVALDIAGGPAFVDALRRVWDHGDAAMPLDRRLPPPAARAVLDALRPGAVIEADGEQRHLDAGRPVEEGDALVMATSGSTGAPKGVVLTHHAVTASAAATNERLAVDPTTDLWLACLPLAHIGGLAVVTRAILSDTPVQVFDGFDPATIEAATTAGINDGRQVLVSLVTAALRRLQTDRFRTILLGGAAPPGHLPDNVVVTYGMTETGSGLVYNGLPLRGAEITIEPAEPGDSGKPGNSGKPGQILLRGPMLFRCYRDGSDQRRPDGWFPTGDAGHIDEHGHLQVAGRIAEVIVSGGEQVWPAEVERILAGLPGIDSVAIGGLPDPVWGHRVVAYVVPRPGSRPPVLEELRAAVKAVAGSWCAPRQLVLVPRLPRTPNGKVRRSALAALCQ